MAIEKANLEKMMNISQIMDNLPHRYPFLLLDRVLDYTKFERLLAIKNVSYNEPFFQGHFPGQPVMPGVLIIEALAQAAGVLTFLSVEHKPTEYLCYLAGINNARFRRPVEPGDTLSLDVTLIQNRRLMSIFACVATVENKVVCDVELMCACREMTS